MMAEGQDWSCARHTQYPWPYTHPLTRGPRLSWEAWGSILTVTLKEKHMGRRPHLLAPRTPLPRTGTPRCQLSYFFSFLPRGTNWALKSGVSGKTLGQRKQKRAPKLLSPAPTHCPSRALSSSIHTTEHGPQGLTGSPGSPGAVSPSPGPGGPWERTAGQGMARGNQTPSRPLRTFPSLTRSPRSPLSPWKTNRDAMTLDHTSTPQDPRRNERHGVQRVTKVM